MSQVNVQLARAEPADAAMPAILRFPAGLPYRLTDAQETKINVFQHSAPEKAANRVVWVDSDLVHYEGKNFGPRSYKRTSGRKFGVGLYNVDSQQLSMSDADLFVMKQIVQGVDDVDPEEFANPSESNNIGTKKRTLIDTFGSKKKQRQLRSVAASQVKPEDEGSLGALNVALSESAMVESVDVKPDSMLNTSILPPYTLNTKVLSEVYPIHGIIPEDVWELLEWHAFLKAVGGERDRYPVTVVELARRLGIKWKETTAADRERCGKAILFLFYLIQFAGLPKFIPSFNMVQERLENVPVAVAEHLLNTFAEPAAAREKREDAEDSGSAYSRSKHQQDKLQAYICVCALLATGTYELTRNAVLCMIGDLKVVETNAVAYFKQLGCTVTRQKAAGVDEATHLQSVMVKLKAPLVFPKMSMGARKK